MYLLFICMRQENIEIMMGHGSGVGINRWRGYVAMNALACKKAGRI